MTKIQAIIFDWAGTMIDFGSRAPVAAFQTAFERAGVPATVAEAREPMGLPKRDHIVAMLAAPRLQEAWVAAKGSAPTEADIDDLYADFQARTPDIVAAYTDLVPGALAMLVELAKREIKVGSTTGYTRAIMERVCPIARDQGYVPMNVVCADDLPEGRPGPLGMYQCFIDLRVHPPETVLKVDDTAPGIAEGVAAGCPTVGVALSGNLAGLTPPELRALSDAERYAIRKNATAQLKAAGATHVIDTVADLPALLDQHYS
jgi:phosphonoacetaldehyde hydrolase